VNLAEVASVHQILSLLGQKAKVPPEVRDRMYQLVKGREAISPRSTSPSRPRPPEPVTEPLQPWVVPEAPPRPWLERFGPAVACIVLILISSWSAWHSLSSPAPRTVAPPELALAPRNEAVEPEPAGAGATAPEAEKSETAGAGGAPQASAEAARAAAAQPEPNRATESAATDSANPPAKSEAADAVRATRSSPPGTKAQVAASAATVAAGSAALAEKPDGVLLRYNPRERAWERLTEATPLDRPDRLLCLAPFRASISLGKIRVTLVGETEVRILSLSSDSVPVLELVQGRLQIRQPTANPLKIVFDDRAVTLEMSPEDNLAVERLEAHSYGQPVNRTAPLAIYCIQGDLTLALDQHTEPLRAAHVAVIDPAGQVKQSEPDTLPNWVTQNEPSSYELQIRDQFVRIFHPGRPVLTDIVVATEDDRPEIKQLAVGALKALGDLSYLMPILTRPGDPVARRAAIAAIRSYIGQGPEAARRVREPLNDEFGAKLGAQAEHLLIGYTPEEAANRDTYPRLVALLSPDQTSIGIRELALDSLKRLTGRDDLGYDPDQPAGKGFEAWNELLRRNELRPLQARPKAK
jgi:hypothetical protein